MDGRHCVSQVALTDDERDHGCAISPSSFEALYELLDFPNFNVLFGLVGLWGAHGALWG